MITSDCILKYQEQFNTYQCAYYEPSTPPLVFIEDSNGKAYIQPENETDEIFLDRLERSITAGENLFFKEWDKLNDLPSDLLDYIVSHLIYAVRKWKIRRQEARGRKRRPLVQKKILESFFNRKQY